MAGHSRSKNGVASRAFVPAIPFKGARPCPPKRDHRDKPGDDKDYRRMCSSTAAVGQQSTFNPLFF
jgi:hypothetical protein